MVDELTPLNDKLEPETQLLPGVTGKSPSDDWRDAAIMSSAISLKRIADTLDNAFDAWYDSVFK